MPMSSAACFSLAAAMLVGIIWCWKDWYFSPLQVEKRAIRRRRKWRRFAHEILRSTANRDCYREFKR